MANLNQINDQQDLVCQKCKDPIPLNNSECDGGETFCSWQCKLNSLPNPFVQIGAPYL